MCVFFLQYRLYFRLPHNQKAFLLQVFFCFSHFILSYFAFRAPGSVVVCSSRLVFYLPSVKLHQSAGWIPTSAILCFIIVRRKHPVPRLFFPSFSFFFQCCVDLFEETVLSSAIAEAQLGTPAHIVFFLLLPLSFSHPLMRNETEAPIVFSRRGGISAAARP